MEVKGKNQSGSTFLIEIDGQEIWVPDDITNPYRQKIKFEWEDEGREIPILDSTATIAHSILVENVWMNMSDEEAEDFESAMSSASLRIRKAFNLAVILTEGTELFTYVKATLTSLFGDVRARAILGLPPLPETETEE